MKTYPLSEKIRDKGILIDINDNNEIFKIDKENIIQLFEKHGVILFKNFKLNPKKLTLFTDIFTSRYSSDALRREIRFDNKNIRNVDGGNLKIDLHSESSFNPAWPEIIWFYCNDNSAKGGETILCDGSKLWDKLSLDTKNYFQENLIKYKLRIPIIKKLKAKGRKNWPMNSHGVSNSFIDWDEGNLYLNQIRSAIVEGRNDNSLCFSNHLFINLKSEPQILSRRTNNDSNIPQKYFDEIQSCSKVTELNIKLDKNDLLMLDNKRFMHGRNAFSKSGKRDIVNIQTFKASFGYGATLRST